MTRFRSISRPHEYTVWEEMTFVNNLAVLGANMAERRRGKPFRQEQKPDGTWVTDVDREISDFIMKITKHNRPTYGVCGEEGSYGVDRSNIVRCDPIDGTHAFMRGEVGSSTGVSVQWGGELVVGAVAVPSLKQWFWAGKGIGARRNGLPIRTGAFTLESGLPYDFCHWQGAPLDNIWLKNQLGWTNEKKTSALVQGCRVAMGATAFSIFPGKGLHDVAAAAVIVEQAGGVAMDMTGRPIDWRATELARGAILACNQDCAQGVVQLLEPKIDEWFSRLPQQEA